MPSAYSTTHSTSLAALVLLALLVACDPPPPLTDAGPDATTGTCSGDSACDDGLFCNGAEVCEPASPSADASGCRAGDPPCDATQVCDESGAECQAPNCDTPDADSDGHDAIACGGDDCDDADADRFPGNAEVCDAGHDEDCDETTLGGRDGDGDGFVDALCCNGATCGDDCADDDGNVNVGAREVCDGVDNDCSGGSDDGSNLCPGGTCAGGGCSFSGWNRSLGGPGRDSALHVALDAAGNVYIAGAIEDEAELGLGAESVPAGVRAPFVARYAPDRTPEWTHVESSSAFGIGLDVAPDGSAVYLLTSDGRIVRVSADGATVSETTLDFEPVALAVDAAGAIVVLGLRTTSGASDSAMVIARYDGALAPTGEEVVAADGANPERSIFATAFALAPDGGVVVGGLYADGGITLPQVGGGSVSLPDPGGEGATFLLRIAPSGEALYGYSVDVGVDVDAVAVASDERVFVSGGFDGSVDLASLGTIVASDASSDGYVLALTAGGGLDWIHTFGGAGGAETGRSLALSSSGALYFAGEFASPTDFGDGVIRNPTTVGTIEGFLVRYLPETGVANAFFRYGEGATLAGIRDVAVGPGDAVVVVGVFEGDIDLGSGAVSSQGDRDGFVLRLGT